MLPSEPTPSVDSIVGQVLELYPAMAARCDRAAIVAALDAWGVADADVLDVVLQQPAMTSSLVGALQGVAPPCFVALLVASRGATPDDVPDPSGVRVDIVVDEGDEAPVARKPGALRLAMRLLPLIEWLVPKDHAREWKEHLIESRLHDPTSLREAMLSMFEMELLLSALFFGVVTSIFYTGGVRDEELLEFRRMRAHDIGFWVVLFGVATTFYAFWTCMTTYLAIQLIMPVSDANLPALLKSPAVVTALMIPNVCLVTMFYSAMAFLITATLTRIGVSAFTVAVICAVCLPPMSFIYPYFGLGFNFALDAGLFSVDPVVHADKVSTSTPHEVEAMLVAKATATVRKHGRTRHTLSSSTGAIDDLYSKRSDAPPAKSGHGMKKRKTPMRTRGSGKHAAHEAVVIGAA